MLGSKYIRFKMKAEKMIPISLVLYRIMKIYIKKHHIKTTEFLFKAQDGGAYRTGTFLSGFRSNCKKYGVCLSEINLKPMITGIPWQAAFMIMEYLFRQYAIIWVITMKI